MPAINVARTDTFEQQRLKINEIGSQIFSITQGGSDLATGNLKIGDGTRTLPSLAFASDASLGIYKSDSSTIGYVASGKKLADFGSSSNISFRDFILQKNQLISSGISFVSGGSNYDSGTYSNVNITGGTGDGATVNITVEEFVGSITNTGSNYNEGTFANIPIVGGSGSGANLEFTVSGIEGEITNSGSGYVPGQYNNVSLIGGSGSGATANITVTGTVTTSGNISSSGSSYSSGTYSSVFLTNTPTQVFVLSTTTNPGSPPPDNVYVVDGNTQQSLTLVIGNTYRFDISDPSLIGHPLIFSDLSDQPLGPDYFTITKGQIGTSGSYIDFIVRPYAIPSTIKYDCSVHTGMGSTINIISGTSGQYGSNIIADIEVNLAGQISSVTITSSGGGYQSGDVLQVYSPDIASSGSGFEYTISGINYGGIISSVTITNNGIDYENNDVLSSQNTDLDLYGRAIGSGFLYTINSFPGKITDITFGSKGTGYQTGDLLTITGKIENISTILPGEKIGVETTLDTGTSVITVSDTTGIVSGMLVINGGSDIGLLSPSTTVLSVDSSTQITLSANPSISGAASLSFRSDPLNEITIPDTSGILQQSTLSIVSGNGQFADNTTVISVLDSTTLQISATPLVAGNVVIDIIPPYGDASADFEYTVGNLGVVTNFSIEDGGNGYAVSDTLSVNATDLTSPIVYSVVNRPVSKIDFTTSYNISEFSIGDEVKKKDGTIQIVTEISSPAVSQTVISDISTTLSDSSPIITVLDTTGIVSGMIVTQGGSDTGILAAQTTVFSVDSSTQITLSDTPLLSGTSSLTFSSDEFGSFSGVASSTSGNGSGATFNIIRQSNGNIASIQIDDGGFYYQNSDTITISGSLIGGSSPTHDISLEVSDVTFEQVREIYDVVSSNGTTIDFLVIDSTTYSASDVLIKIGTISPEYTISNIFDESKRFFIDTGSGYKYSPNITFYSGNTYTFDYSNSSNQGHLFSFSQFRDGNWTPSLFDNLSTTLDIFSKNITLDSTSGIIPGMQVFVISGDGSLVSETLVESIVNSTTITLSKFPLASGDAVIRIAGYQYTDGVSRSTDSITIKISNSTASPLYYYCSSQPQSLHQNEGGYDSNEVQIIVDQNNPKTFGSGFELLVADISSSNSITMDIEDGSITCSDLISVDGTFSNLSINNTLTAPSIIGGSISLSTISSGALSVTCPQTSFSGNVDIGSALQIASSSGNLTTSGIIKTTGSFNSNDNIIIQNNIISSTSSNNILLSPAANRVVTINSTTALIIPSGGSAARPAAGVVANGAIRYNTDTGQYEGYSAATASWSSLGGVRDLDGNTYIAAEASIGANDNTLYFFNDGNNTVSVTPNYLQFVNVKKIRSLNTTAPAFIEYTTNTQVTLGQYLKYRNNIYEVTVAGQTGSSGNEPTHTTGAVTNGTAELTWSATAVAPLTFEEVEEVRIDPLGFTDLVVNNELRFSNNTISTDLNDLIVRPNSGKKVTIDAESSLVIPVGDNNQRGVAAQGSIRYNTDISQYEGYDGANWTSLGGVKDVDGNTYIIPETAPGANENILYFYNDGINTMRLSTNSLEFTNIDAITTQNNNLDIEASSVTFNGLAATIDTSGTSTFISTTKDNLDLGLAVGLNVDPLLRLDINGDVYINKGFGTGSFDGIKLFNSDLSTLELSDLAISSDDIALIKGGTNSGASVLYDPTRDSGAKVTVSIVNQTTGDKEMIEYQVIDKGSDIYHTDIGNLNTGVNLVTSVFDFDANNNVRVTFTLTDLTVGDVVNITVVKHIFKK